MEEEVPSIIRCEVPIGTAAKNIAAFPTPGALLLPAAVIFIFVESAYVDTPTS
jgi:hypothetical protein